MSAFRPLHFQPQRPGASELLRLSTTWCVEHIPAHPPCAIGIEPTVHSVQFHLIELDGTDPLGELSTLAAPDEWAAIVLSGQAVGPFTERFVHGVDRLGRVYTQIRFQDGAVAASGSAVGTLTRICRQVLEGGEFLAAG